MHEFNSKETSAILEVYPLVTSAMLGDYFVKTGAMLANLTYRVASIY
jgi:hypothetical protein